jgi:putative nucleotidyltransferase with HDIG domain
MNKRILFVDDEIRVLEGLERMLRAERREWEMQFAPGGKEALEILANKTFDVIVTDMRMPGMDGAQLLSEVMTKYPGMVRIILSGHSDQEIILKTVRTAHQYLSKPCEAEVIKKTIIRTCKLQDILTSETLRGIVSRIESLPIAPSIYFEITEEINSSDPSVKKVGGIIEKDLGMSAKVLQLVNSAFFALPRHIASPSQAVSLLGLDIMKSLVLSIHVFSQFAQSSLRHFSLNGLWEHSMRVSKFSKYILELERCEKTAVDYGFMAGMLHDVGKLILASNLPDQYDEVLRLVSEGTVQLHEAEKKTISASHAEMGAYLLGLWGLPQPVIETIAYHHDIGNLFESDMTPLVAVHFGNCLDMELNPAKDFGAALPLDLTWLEKNGFGKKIPSWREGCLKLMTEAKNEQ